MEQIKTFRETSTGRTIWLNMPVMKAATPLIIATSIMIGQNQPSQITTNTGRMITIEDTNSAWHKPISFLPEGNVMAKDVKSSNGNNDSYSFDPIDYGRLSQRVDSMDKKIDSIIVSLDKLPTKDWVENETKNITIENLKNAIGDLQKDRDKRDRRNVAIVTIGAPIIYSLLKIAFGF
ncbi:hypothetical protein [Lacticaseibacillus songhuajiangensis]|uniref:hypothetical protein n=1 Tax=Lacticaseibacillus songhuajiangensis TaxID=1296539 RepID=UPI000F78259B|nr:hypothetical protein [Lacticaseibacillus songhuajiangensis]